LDVASLTLNLDLLLLDETPLFFKLRTNLGLINHFVSLKRLSMRAIRDKALSYNRTKKYAITPDKTVSFCTLDSQAWTHAPPKARSAFSGGQCLLP
jgi:hypothetical protein